MDPEGLDRSSHSPLIRLAGIPPVIDWRTCPPAPQAWSTPPPPSSAATPLCLPMCRATPAPPPSTVLYRSQGRM